MRKLNIGIQMTVLLAVATVAHAGPIIIAGTDADDHGSGNAATNSTGWLFMQQAFTRLGAGVTNGNNVGVCLGCNAGEASSAFNNSFGLAGLAGWTNVSLTSVTDITNFFNGTGVRNLSNTGIIYMPTVAGNVGGGITNAQLAPVNSNGIAINNFLAGGGGLFTQEQANSTVGYGWLSSLLPGLLVRGDSAGGVANSGTLQLTADGNSQFPGLTNTDLSRATPWHAYFSGNFGALQVLVVGNGDGVGGLNDAVVLGGGFTAGGGGGVIVCGSPGQPACSSEIPEPSSFVLLGLGTLGIAGLHFRRKK